MKPKQKSEQMHFQKYFCLLIFLLLQKSLSAQPLIDWKKCYGGTREDYTSSLIQTKDGGYFVCGDSRSTDYDVKGTHGDDGWAIKLDPMGSIEWQKCLGGSNQEQLFSGCQTKDGGYAVTGYTNSNDGDVTGLHDSEKMDVWVVKLNDSGKIQWAKTFGGTNDEMATCIIQTLDGGFIIAASTVSTDGDISQIFDNSYWHAWVIKIDSIGNIQWQKILDPSLGYNGISSIILTEDGNYALAGSTSSKMEGLILHGKVDVWVIKLNNSGSILWQKTFGGSDNDNGQSIIQTKEGGYAVIGTTQSKDGEVTGYHDSVGFSFPDMWMVKLNNNGILQWQKTLGGKDWDKGSSIQQKDDGGYMLLGSTLSNDGDVTGLHRSIDAWLVEIDSIGNLQWQSAFGSFYVDYGGSLIRTTDKGFAFAASVGYGGGDVTGFHPGNTTNIDDYWVVKFSSQKNSIPVPNLSGINVTLYPNPNPGIGKINYTLEKSSHIQVEVYDAIGRQIQVISDDFVVSGNHEQKFDLSDYPSGQYFFHVESDGISIVKGFALIK
jgi:hypothetical protein